MTAAPPLPKPGDSFSKRYVFTRESIARFIAESGDINRLHHDEDFARKSRFGGIIASGTQSTAVLTGFIAEQYPVNSLGLENCVRFTRGIPAGLSATLSWKVVAVEPKAKLGGHIVSLAGEIRGDDGLVYMTATSRILYTQSLATR